MRDQANVAHPKVWTVDKSIPLALIISILFQGAVGIWWASNISTRTENVEKLVAAATAQQSAMQEAAQVRSDRTTTTLQSISERTVRLEVGLESLRNTMEQIARNVSTGGVVPQ